MIKRLVRAKKHLRRQVIVDNLQKDANALSTADVAARIKKVRAATNDATSRSYKSVLNFVRELQPISK